MKRLKLVLMGGLLLWASAAWSVSRVGGGILGNEEVGFIASLSPDYTRYYIAADDDVRMDASPVFNNGRLQSRTIMVFMLKNEQPQWVGRTDRLEFQNHFFGLGWQALRHSDPCVEHFEKINSSTVTRVLSWGDGRGIIVTSAIAQYEDVKAMANSTTLDPGACSWK